MRKIFYGNDNGSAHLRAFLIPIVAVAAVGANAQWSVELLNPGTQSSIGNGVQSGQQVGAAFVGPYYHASLWTGSAASWVDLNPAGAERSYTFGVGDGQQVGMIRMPGSRDHASLWTGTAGSWVNLNPSWATSSFARKTRGGFQVGNVDIEGRHQAALWNGTAESAVVLTPAGIDYSEAFDLWGNQQVGSAFVITGPYGRRHASLWSSTAESWVDLDPDIGGAGGSEALGIYEDQQVGIFRNKAGYWTGTAESWVSLHPAHIVERSTASAVYDGIQVGSVVVEGVRVASLWSGTAESWVDLGAYLPSQYTQSEANDVWHDGTDVYVVGSAYNGTDWEAVMWTAPVPEPASMLALGAALSALMIRRRRKKL